MMPRDAGATPARPVSAPAWVDVSGAASLALLCVATLVQARGDRSQLLLLLVAAVAALLAGRALGAMHRALVPGAVIAAAVVVGVADAAGWTWIGRHGGPPGFDASTWALLAQAAVAVAMVAVALRPLRPRPGLARSVVAAAAVAFVAVLATTVALGAAYRAGDHPAGLEGALRSAVARYDVALWHAALEILSERPAGVGPGRFDDVPPRFLPVGDVRWAEHDVLQQGAELGWLGLIGTVLLFLWGFARLWVHPAPDAYVALGAVALAVLGVSACVSHALHVPALPVLGAALLGSAQAIVPSTTSAAATSR